MGFVGRLRAGLFSPPLLRPFFWLPLGYGLLTMTVALASVYVDNPQSRLLRLDPSFAVLGMAFAFLGVAELLPTTDRRVTGVLRLWSVCSFVLFGVILLASVL